jgi:transketolase
MNAFVPAFNEDLPKIVEKLMDFPHPAYLRLGWVDKLPKIKIPAYSPWRKLTQGLGPTVLIAGSIAGGLLGLFLDLSNPKRPNTWVLTELPITKEDVPLEFINDIQSSGHLVVIEEHVAHGGAGEMIGRCLLLLGKAPTRFTHFCAQGYLSGRYGSQQFHRHECGLSTDQIMKELL